MSPSRFTITYFNLNELLNESKHQLILVSIFSNWSGASFIIESFINDLSDKYPQVKFIQAPIEKTKEAQAFAEGKVYPFLLFLKNGEISWESEGLIRKAKLDDLIQKMIA